MSSTQLCPSLPEDEREAMEAGWNEHPGLRHLGVRVDLSAPDVVRVYVDPVQPHHRGGLGTAAVNGAVIAAAFDVTIGLVGHLCHADRRTGTAQLSIHFLQPVVGDRFEILGRLTRAGRSSSRPQIFMTNIGGSAPAAKASWQSREDRRRRPKSGWLFRDRETTGRKEVLTKSSCFAEGS